MEVAGAVAAFPPLLILIHQTAKSLYKCAKTISVAKEKVSSLADETTVFASLLANLHDTIENAEQTEESHVIQLDIKCCEAIIRQGEQSIAMMYRLLETLYPLRSDARCTRLDVLLARLKWYAHTEDFSTIAMTMNSVKASASLLVSILHLKQILRMCQQHVNIDSNIPLPLLEKIKRYRRQIKSLKAQIITLHERCRSADTMSAAVQRMNVVLLDHANQLQREHAREDPALRLALRSPTDVIGTGDFVARLLYLSNRSTLPSDNGGRQTATASGAQSSPQTSTSGSQGSTNGTRSSAGTSSTSETRSFLHREGSDDERPTARRRPTNGVPTALFRDDDRLSPPPPRRARPAVQDDPQYIIVDRNDGAGVQEEFRRPRRDQHRRGSGHQK